MRIENENAHRSINSALLPVAAHAQSNPSLATSRGQKYHSYQEMNPGIKRKWTTRYTKRKTNHTKTRSKHTGLKKSPTLEDAR
jgi:hypothetical protein